MKGIDESNNRKKAKERIGIEDFESINKAAEVWDDGRWKERLN